MSLAIRRSQTALTWQQTNSDRHPAAEEPARSTKARDGGRTGYLIIQIDDRGPPASPGDYSPAPNATRVIFTGNQSTLQALRNPGSQSGQYILEAIIMALNKGRKAGLNVHFRWIPAHRGVEGNEQADRIAKEATGWRRIRCHRGRMIEVMTEETSPRPHYLKTIRSAVKRRVHEVVNARWENGWKSCHHSRELYELTPIPTPTKKVLRVHQDLHRALSTIIVQMRTGKIGLRHYLSQKGLPGVPNRDCQCEKAAQSVRHIFLACPTLSGLREEIFGRRS
jgi:hypothetical protein